MIGGVYGFDPNDPLGLKEKPSSRELAGDGKSGITEAVKTAVGKTPPILKPKPKARPLAQTSSIALAGGYPAAPVHEALRQRKGTLEHAMAELDREIGWSRNDPKREEIKYRLQRLAANSPAAARGEKSLLDELPQDYKNQLVRDLNRKVGEAAATAADVLGPAQIPSGIKRGVGRFAAGAVNPIQQAEMMAQVAADPLAVPDALVGQPVRTLVDPKASLEQKTEAGLGLGLLAAPLVPKAAGLIRGRLPKAPALPEAAAAPKFDLGDPLGLREVPNAVQEQGPAPKVVRDQPKVGAGLRVENPKGKAVAGKGETQKVAAAKPVPAGFVPKELPGYDAGLKGNTTAPDLKAGLGEKPKEPPPIRVKEVVTWKPGMLAKAEGEGGRYVVVDSIGVNPKTGEDWVWFSDAKYAYNGPAKSLSHRTEPLPPNDLEPWAWRKADAERRLFYGDQQSAVQQTAEIGDERTWWRYGNLPPGGKSKNHATGAMEEGVSVYPTPFSEGISGDFGGRKQFYGKGKLLGFGSDQEPLIQPIGEWAEWPGHKGVVAKALAEGKPVPPEVLRDYPDLAAKYGQAAAKEPKPKAEVPNPEPPKFDVGEGQGSPKAKAGTFDTPIRDLDASRYAGPTPRVAPAPIQGAKPKKLGEIIYDASKSLGKKVQYGGVRKRAAGTYHPGNAATKIRYAGDLDTTAHELAHALDDQHGIVSKWAGNRVRSPFDQELSQFWQHGSVTKSGPRAKLSYRRAEGVAEWVRAWLVNPAEAERMAPQFAKHFKTNVPAEVQKSLRTFGDEIRGLAGASAKDQIMASIRWEPPKGGLTEWVKGLRDPEGPGFNLTYWDKVQQKWVDSLKPFTKAVKYLKDQRGIDTLSPTRDPELLARLVNGATSKMDDIFENGMIDAKGARVTKGFADMFGDLEGKTAAALTEEMQDVASYMIAQRVLEKQGQLGKERVSGIGGGVTSERALAEARLREVKADPERFARIEKAAKKYRDWSDAVLRYLVDKGRISKKAYDAIKANNEHYVAMKRILEVGPEEEIVSFRGRGGKGLGSHSQVVQRFKGSTRKIQNPYEALLEATYKAIREADRNEVQQAFFDLAKEDRAMYQGDPRDLASVTRKATAADKNNVQTVFVDGKAQRWVIPDPDLYRAFKGITENPAILPGWATISAKALRWGVTHFPEFAVRNKIRDALTTAVVSEHGTNLVDMFKRAAPGVFDEFRKAGGGQFGTYMKDASAYYGKMNEAVRDLAKSRNTVVVNPIAMAGKGYKKLLEGSEVSTRLAEFARAKKHAVEKLGYSEHEANLYAAASARDLLDFAVAGDYMKVINQVVPFTNAAMQGLSKIIRSVRKNPTGTALRWGTYVLIPTAAEKAFNVLHGNQKEYEQLPAYQRDLFWNFKMGPDLWLSVPKPFELGVLGSFFGRAADQALGDEKAFEGYARSAAEAISPIGRSEILSGPIPGMTGAAANYDFFRERPIVPPYEESLALKHRKTDRASRLGQTLQDILGIDARKIDFVIRQQFGYAGKYAVDISDIGREDKKSTEDKALGMTGVVRSGPVSAARDVVWLQDYAHENGLTQSKAFKALREKLSAYYNAKGPEAKEKAGAEVRRYALDLRADWEKNRPEKKKAGPKVPAAKPIPADVGRKVRNQIRRKLTPTLR